MDNAPVLIRLREVMARTGLSRAAIYGNKTFPRSVPLGERSSAWVRAEVDEWIAGRIAARASTMGARTEHARRMLLKRKDRSTEKLAA